MVEGGRSGGPFTFHMEVHSCTQTQDRFKSYFVKSVLVEARHNNDYPYQLRVHPQERRSSWDCDGEDNLLLLPRT